MGKKSEFRQKRNMGPELGMVDSGGKNPTAAQRLFLQSRRGGRYYPGPRGVGVFGGPIWKAPPLAFRTLLLPSGAKMWR